MDVTQHSCRKILCRINKCIIPNPSSNNVTVDFVLTENADVQLEVVDLSGRLVYKSEKQNYSIGQHSVNLQSNQWRKGIYFIKLKANEKSKTVKFIKQ